MLERQMDERGIPSVVTDDRRTAPKDQRTQSHQSSLLLNHPDSIKRRREWLARQQEKLSDHEEKERLETLVIKRKRAPNRRKEVIEEEKQLKNARQQLKIQQRGPNLLTSSPTDAKGLI